MNTLATEGSKKKYDFTVQNDGDDVKLQTKVVTATITGTLIDADPLAVFKVDKVLLPGELFKSAPAAPGPKPARSRHASKSDSDDDADAPGPAEDDDSAVADDDTASGAGRISGGLFVSLVVGILMSFF